MRILTIGARGQVAQALAALQTPETQIRCLGRPYLDVCDANSVKLGVDHFRPDLIINASAYTAVDKAETDAENAFRLNRDGPALLAEICAHRNLPLIHISTDYVFDGRKTGAYLPDDPIGPLNVYGASKAAGEAAIREILPQHIILRTSWVFSPFGQNFVRSMVSLARKMPEVRVVDDQVGSPTSALDLAAALVQIASNLTATPKNEDLLGTFHFTNAGTTTWHGLAREVFRLAEPALGRLCSAIPIATSEYPYEAERPANSALDCSSLELHHGIIRREWEPAVAEVVDRLTRT